MTVYQCFFFSNGRIEYWENVECEAYPELKLLLGRRISEENWDVIEAWMGDQLICRSTKLPDGIEGSLDFNKAGNGSRRLGG